MCANLLRMLRNAIEYATGSVSTKWGSLRAAMGHPAPFKLTYVEIGNENWGPEYNERYEKFYSELKALYPHLKFISNTHTERDGLPARDSRRTLLQCTRIPLPKIWIVIIVIQEAAPEIFKVGEFAVTAVVITPRLRAMKLPKRCSWSGLRRIRTL